MKFRTKYNRRRIMSPVGSVSMTDPQYKDDCSIDGIIRRYGILPPPSPAELRAFDCSEFSDYAACMEKVVDATSQFESLPADVRERFGHDPAAFFKFVSDPKNVEEGVKLGLFVVRKEEKDPVEILERIADGVKSQGDSNEA